ncbi:MAG: hypothetical protein CMN28_06550 [Salinisphaeraceae bacterium]|nr:hypothetical protein [Salinisphaeraceae bacterium]
MERDLPEMIRNPNQYRPAGKDARLEPRWEGPSAMRRSSVYDIDVVVFQERTMLSKFQNAMIAMAVRKQTGATLIEYVLIVAVIAIAVFAASQAGLVEAITGIFSEAQTTIEGASDGTG